MTTVREMTDDERRAYDREKRRALRLKRKAEKASGRLNDDEATIREVLADAALVVLRAGGTDPAAVALANLVRGAFLDRPGMFMCGVGATLAQRKMKPKVLSARR
ncbi:hypothetical protein [Pleomorphomonas carboxyditropha]|uniref:Conjugal transfer protein TraD n=1 Tax=Pleomorphomonas carboxyditropha TaxID=2023338 RepID=A0A2G9X112_9HYPH|nr:hypothetical protein [Pleomorphomonas carboxyditropha]PIP00659.1 hypothetical protein CJ014_00720 [Pleomorphomonas carboxyditropha]